MEQLQRSVQTCEARVRDGVRYQELQRWPKCPDYFYACGRHPQSPALFESLITHKVSMGRMMQAYKSWRNTQLLVLAIKMLPSSGEHCFVREAAVKQHEIRRSARRQKPNQISRLQVTITLSIQMHTEDGEGLTTFAVPQPSHTLSIRWSLGTFITANLVELAAQVYMLYLMLLL